MPTLFYNILTMPKQFLTFLQRFLPQHTLSQLMGRLAESHYPWIKDYLINQFSRRYQINLDEALISDPKNYPTFNSFFIRQLKPNARPIAEGDLISPVDGTIAQLGHIHKNQLLQAKQHYFDLETLLGNDTQLAQTFYDGNFATLYLAPHNYHRVHMPIAGKLIKTIYVPGKLFSVNRITSELIPNLYSRNERLICVFETAAGKVAVILVGAMIVGSIQTAWMDQPIRAKQIITQSFSDGMPLTKGAELGYFKVGSTVILLFEKNKIEWLSSITSESQIQLGQLFGKILH